VKSRKQLIQVTEAGSSYLVHRKFFLDTSGNFIFKSTSRLDSLSAIINQKDIRHQNRTPLFMAAAQNNVKAANALLIHGADVNTTDDRNCTPLFVAVEHGSMEVVELLICRGAHVDVMNTSSYRLLDVAFVQRDHGEWSTFFSWPAYRADE
jgi:hypothetical protein